MSLFPLGLLSQGGGAAPSFELIQTQLINGSSPTSVTFSSIASTYKHLQLRIVSRWNAGGSSNDLRMQINGDTTSNYYGHWLRGQGSSVTSGQSNLIAYMQLGNSDPSGVDANTFGVQIVDILDYANTNKNKTIRSFTGRAPNGYSQEVGLYSGIRFSTDAVSSLTIYGSQGGSYFLSGCRLSLYGIKG